MPKSKLKLDITCLTPRQRRRIFLKNFYNICQMTVKNSNGLEVQNEFVNESNEPDDIEQLPQQQNILREIDFDYSNVINGSVPFDHVAIDHRPDWTRCF